MKKVGVFIFCFVFMLAVSGFVVAETCEITNIYATQVEGYVYSELFIMVDNMIEGVVFGIMGADSYDSLVFEVDVVAGDSKILKATQTFSAGAISYIFERKDNIQLTYEGEVVCKQDVTAGCCSVSISGESCVVSTAENCADDSFFVEGVLCSQTSYCQDVSNMTDFTAPVVLGASPYGTVYSNSVQLSLDTDEVARCAYATKDVDFDSMTPFFNTGSTQHWQELNLLYGTYDYYIRCSDTNGNVNLESFFVSFEVAKEELNRMSVNINRGWNLIYGFVDPEQIVDSNYISEDNIKAIYALMPNLQEYARAWPDPEWEKLNTLDDDEILNSGLWVYSDKSGRMIYNLYTDVIPFYKRQMYDGWNFVGITEDMFGGGSSFEFKNIVGSCDILRSYIFDSNDQRWEEMPLDVRVDNFEAIGQTWVINVDDDCNLGETPSIIPAPPTLPEIESDLETDEPLEIEGYLLMDVQTEEGCDEFNEGGVSGEVCMVMTNLRYENSEIGDSVYLTLIDYTKGFEVFKEIINQYFSGVNSEYEYAYDLEGDNAIVWFSAGPYDIIVSERSDEIAANHVTNYFYNKYPAYDAGIDIIARCRDSDGGLDYYTKGKVVDKNGYVVNDVCDSRGVLIERECISNDPIGSDMYGAYNNVAYDCPNGCFDGACIIPDEGYDSDGGVNYEERGTCVDDKEGYVRTYTDTCGYWYDGDYNPNVLTEWRADTEFGCWGDQYECPELCVEGACIEDGYNVVDMTNAEVKAEIEILFGDSEKRIVVYLANRMATIKAGGSYGVAFGIKNIEQGTVDTGLFRYEVTVNDDVQQKCDLSEREVEAWIVAGRTDTLAIAPGKSSIGIIRFIVPENTQGCNVRFYIDVVKDDSLTYATDVFDINIV